MSATDAERLVQIAALAAIEHCRAVTPAATVADLAAYVHDHTIGYLLTAWLASPRAAMRVAAEALNEAVGARAPREALREALCRTSPGVTERGRYVQPITIKRRLVSRLPPVRCEGLAR